MAVTRSISASSCEVRSRKISVEERYLTLALGVGLPPDDVDFGEEPRENRVRRLMALVYTILLVQQRLDLLPQVAPARVP